MAAASHRPGSAILVFAIGVTAPRVFFVTTAFFLLVRFLAIMVPIVMGILAASGLGFVGLGGVLADDRSCGTTGTGTDHRAVFAANGLAYCRPCCAADRTTDDCAALT